MALAEKSLIEFIKHGWYIVEPKTPFIDGWHLHAICEHLEAVSAGQIQNLLVNVPPMHMKSLAVSVFFPAWEWTQNPHLRYLCTSYAESLSKRDSVKCRNIIQSLWYQARWGSIVQISSDQNEKMRFENTEKGYRSATSTMGIGTGESCDRIINDDPHNVTEGESPVKRNSVLTQWDDSMSTRLNDENTGAKIIVMQRVHQNDLSGHVLSEKHGYTHLCLPARYEGKGRSVTCLDWKDPRTEVGEPLWKNKFGTKELDVREKKMSQYAIAAQQQQSPAPRGGGLFKVENFRIEKDFNRSQIVRSVRYWDKAGSRDKGCFTSGVLMHKLTNDFVVIEHIVRGKWEAPEREQRMKQTAEIDGKDVKIVHEQEGGSGGKESAQATNRNLSGYTVEADYPTGTKEVRAEPFASQVQNGSVILIDRGWSGTSIYEYIEELEMSPSGTYSDQVDSSSGAFNRINNLNRKEVKSGVWGLTYMGK